jgi:amidophosphoribosyltransferase
MSGVFGVTSKERCADMLLYGVDYHSHLGTEYGGLAVLGEKFDRRIHNISQAQFKSKFYDDIQGMKGNMGIGVVSDADEQPMYLNSRFGEFCIVTVGLITNQQALVQELLKEGETFSEVGSQGANATELVAKLINKGDSLIDGIEKMFDVIEGSCSLLLLHKDGIYAVRDRMGRTPLAVGKKEGSWAVTLETSAFLNLGFKVVKHLLPGEVVLINDKGMVTQTKGRDVEQICTFLWIYTGFPASTYEGVNVELSREHSGQFLAKRDKDITADLVAGVPDSGVAHAVGYAIEAKIPFRRPLVKYTPGYGRSYTPPSQETRDLIANMKLLAIREIVDGQRVVLCEDSIVRGTQLKNFAIHKLWDCGVKEIHVRPACPPLMFACKFCLSTRTLKELIARRAIRSLEGKDPDDISEYLDHRTEKYKKMVDWICRDIGVTTLRYQTIEDMVKAIGLPKERLCLHCWNGGSCEGTKKRKVAHA